MSVKRVNRIDPMSAAKMMAVMYLILGLVFGIVGLLIASLMPHPEGTPWPGFRVGMIIWMVIFYPICGFIGGFLGALVYNAAAGFIGGIQIELNDDVGS